MSKIEAFDHLVHADWSMHSNKRWAARARCVGGRWRVDAPENIKNCGNFLDDLFHHASRGAVLAGFDFPIGLPAAYAAQAGHTRFRLALEAFGHGIWEEFYTVAERRDEVSVHRPFYPNVSKKGVRRADLEKGLGGIVFKDLLRVCEHACKDGPEASVLFWTLGGKQVGKAALTGWREVIYPALKRGAHLWPFDGDLAALCRKPCLVLAETYPAIAYRAAKAPLMPKESKQSQKDRRNKRDALFHWAAERRVCLSDILCEQIKDGFGSQKTGEDAFDAFMGLTLMLDVVMGRSERYGAISPEKLAIEGWILGRHARTAR